MAGRVQTLDSNAAELEARSVGRCLGHAFGILASNDGQIGQVKLGFLLQMSNKVPTMVVNVEIEVL